MRIPNWLKAGLLGAAILSAPTAWGIVKNATGSGGGGGGAPTDATYIVQTANGSLSAEQALGALATGILKSTTTTGVVSIAASSDVISLFSGTCNSSTYLRADGSCNSPAGAGTVTSVALTITPSWLTVSGSPITGSGTFSVTATTGQTANSFLATPNGSTGTVGLRTIVAADLPLISLTAGVSGILPVANGGTNNAFFTVSGPASTAKTYTFPNASATVLTSNAVVTVAQGGIGVGTLTGIAKGNGTSAFTAAASADVIGLFSGTCTSSSSRFLATDGSCQTASGSGTVTSVGLTGPGGIFGVSGSPVTSSGSITLSTTVTSGGILYGSSSSVVSSSAALTAHGVVIGGGAATAPTSTTAGTSGQVLTSNGSSADPTFQSGLSIPDLPASAGVSSGDLFLVYDISDTQSQQATTTQVATSVLGNGFTAFTGPTTSTKTFTLPNASSTILTSNAAVTVAQGGTGAATLTGILQGNGTSAITGITNSTTVGQTFRVTGSNTYGWGALDLADTDAVTGILPTVNGGTANAFFTVTGPTTSAKTFTFPNASATVLTSNAAVTVAQGGTGAATLTGLLIGNGTSAFTAVTAPSGTVVGTSDTQTLTNKRINPRIQTAADATSVTPTGDSADQTIQANTQTAGTLTMNAPTGTPVDGQKWVFRIKSTNVQTYSWNAIYRGGTTALATASSGSSKTDYYGFLYNSADSKWDFVSTAAGF